MVATLRGLIGLPCWYVSAGGCTLPSFQLALGARVPRDRPLANRAQAEEFRTHQPEAGLLVWCSWRLDEPGQETTSSDSQPEPLLAGLGRLVGRSVERVALTGPARDLTLGFTGGATLRVFCDRVASDGSGGGQENWSLHRADGVLFAGPGHAWGVERDGVVVAGSSGAPGPLTPGSKPPG